MTTITSSLPNPTPTTSLDVVEQRKVVRADNAMSNILNDTEFLKALAGQTSRYLPATRGMVLSFLWGMFNVRGGSFINQQDVERALYATGSGSSGADALWAQLSDSKNGVVSVGEFSTNDYITRVVDANLETIAAKVEETRFTEAAKAGTPSMLEFMSGGGATSVLDFFT